MILKNDGLLELFKKSLIKKIYAYLRMAIQRMSYVYRLKSYFCKVFLILL